MLKQVAGAMVIVSVATCALAKDKKRVVPEQLLRAETVYVMIAPDAGVSVTNPGENQRAREAVEQALRKWGRFRIQTYVADANDADLIIVVRKGGSKTTISGTDPNERPGTVATDPTGINIGLSRGTPGWNPNGTGSNRRPGPGIGTEVTPAEDMFEVYLGHRADPLTGAPAWRYAAKGALNPPAVRAVKEFQKFIEAAEKEQKKP